MDHSQTIHGGVHMPADYLSRTISYLTGTLDFGYKCIPNAWCAVTSNRSFLITLTAMRTDSINLIAVLLGPTRTLNKVRLHQTTMAAT